MIIVRSLNVCQKSEKRNEKHEKHEVCGFTLALIIHSFV